MTTTVKRGTGRPAAAAKRERHAQRTPLPGKNETAAIIAEEVQKTKATRAATRKPAAAEKAPATPATRKRRQPVSDKPRQAPVARSRTRKAPETPDWPKLHALIAVGAENGWKSEVKVIDAEHAHVVSTRGDETIVMPFARGIADPELMPTWTRADRKVQLKNVSACKRQMIGGEGAPVRPEVRAGGKTAAAPRVPTQRQAQKRIPFDPDSATDEEIKAVVYGRLLRWRNGLRDVVESARVLPERYCPRCYKEGEGKACEACKIPIKVQANLTIKPHKERPTRVLTFAAARPQQFFSVALDRLISVK